MNGIDQSSSETQHRIESFILYKILSKIKIKI